MKGIRRLLPTLAVLAALSLGLTTLADAYSGSGALWSMARGEYYLTNRAGNSTGLSAAYTAGGSDAHHQIGPGLESLDLTGLPIGQNILRTTYLGIDFLGRPFRVYDGQLTKRLQVDSLGAALTGALTVSTTLDVTGDATFGGKAVVDDSLRVAATTTLNNGVTVQGGNITLAGDLAITGSTGDGITFAAATSGANITNNAAAKLQLGGRANATTLVLNNSGARDVVVNGDLEAADSLTTAGSLIVDGAANIAGNSWVAGRWTVGDSLRVFEAANFDGGIRATGASWVSGTVDVGDTLRAAVGLRSVGDVDVSTGNVTVKNGNSYRLRDTGGTGRAVLSSSGTDNVNITPLSSTARINLNGTTGATGLSIHPVNGDLWVASTVSVGDSLVVGRDFGGPIVAKKIAADSVLTTGNMTPSGFVTLATGKALVGSGSAAVVLSNTGTYQMKTTGGVDATIIGTAGGTDILRISPLISGGSIDFLNYAASAANMTVKDNGVVVFRSFTHANLPTVTNGGQVYCSDCMGPTDGGYTPGTAASGGSGNMVFGINGTWKGL